MSLAGSGGLVLGIWLGSKLCTIIANIFCSTFMEPKFQAHNSDGFRNLGRGFFWVAMPTFGHVKV